MNKYCTGNTLHGKRQRKKKVGGEKPRGGEALFVGPEDRCCHSGRGVKDANKERRAPV